jgi:transposase
MARYKPYSYGQGQFIPVFFTKQILPGTFEFALNQLVDDKLDLSLFDARFHNDETGAPAYDPRILLKIILFAYSKGITSSREIARSCEQNIVFMALSAHSCPHFSTIADFISSTDKEMIQLFQEVLLVCDEAGLIGREMFAIDGCKLPSNASKEWSGTRNDFQKKAVKLEKAIERIVTRHRKTDALDSPAKLIRNREEQYIETLDKQLKKVRAWLTENDDRTGSRNSIIKSNITDNESAKMKTSKGVIQGYNGVTMVDDKNQIIVAAEAYGHSHEQATLKPMIDQTRENLNDKQDVFSKAKLTADSGFHSEKNMEMLSQEQIDGYVADPKMRSRDPRFDHSGRYKIKAQKERRKRIGKIKKFTPDDFTFDPDLKFCKCPAGKKLYRNGYRVQLGNYEVTKFTAPKSACTDCHLRSQCLRYPEKTAVRQVAYNHGKSPKAPETFISKMKRKIDSTLGQSIYSRRIATAEPPFAQIRHILRLDRFSVRGKRKVNGQWLLICTLYNMRRLHNCSQAMVT